MTPGAPAPDAPDPRPPAAASPFAASDPTAALRDLLPALAWLDGRLARAVAAVPHEFGAHVAGDRYRGLYVSAADAERALDPPPDGAPDAAADAALAQARRDAVAPGTRLQRLADAHGLDRLDVDVLLLALAPELDRRYERLYAYLQDDVAARRPTVALALRLFAGDAVERIARRDRFAAAAPLLAGRVVTLEPGPPPAPPTLLASALQLDDQLTDALVGHDALDRRLAGVCRYDDAPVRPEEAELPPDQLLRLRRHLRALARESRLPVVRLVGAPGSGRRAAAAALAGTLERRLLVLDLAAAAARPDAEPLVALAAREAWLRDAVLYVAGAEALRGAAARPLRRALRPPATRAPAALVLALPDATADVAPDAPTVTLAPPGFERRRVLWAREAARHGLQPDEAGLERLAARFALGPRRIADAAAEAAAGRPLDPAPDSAARDLARLFGAARRQSGAELAALATRLEPVHGFDDLVLPPDAAAQLRELCDRVDGRATVMEAWGFARHLARGRGVNALFSGPPGTGKTMAAEVVAHELGVDLFRVELAGVVSKYIGETEQNLDRIFAAAEHANAVILFDEADALFGKRSEVHDAHDRYANIEISYLLQRMEEYGGVAILSTNLRGNLDAAFLRRLAFTIHFPLPDAADRRRIWERAWPAGVPRDADLALDRLAAQFTLSGGHIRNVALAAAYLAAADGGTVGRRHVLAGLAREYQKLGKALTDAELAPLRAAANGRAP